MSDIEAPTHIPALKTGEGAKRVTRLSDTSDDSSAQQQSGEKQTTPPEKTQETKEKTATYETAVTLATSLSSLQAGSLIQVQYQGKDGQSRPLVTSDKGTYVVKNDPVYQPDIEKIPPNATLEIRVLQVERQIEARLIYNDQTRQKEGLPPLSIPVTLELTGLGDELPKIKPTADQNRLPQEQDKISYQASDLYRASNIAQNSADKLRELPLPTSPTNYTLFEKAVPRRGRPTIIQSSISVNSLIVQEETPPPATKALSGDKSNNNIAPAPTTISSRTQVAPDIGKILYKNTLATVVKTFPKITGELPAIIQDSIGQTAPLEKLIKGNNFTIRIDSVAIPDIVTIPDILDNKIAPRPSPSPEATPDRAKEIQTSPQKTSADSVERPTAPAQPGFSGIVISPAQNLLKQPGQTNLARPRINNPYPEKYRPTSYGQTGTNNSVTTLYVATPVSVIKFNSPVELTPGTVINFSLPDQGAIQGAIQAPAGAEGKTFASTSATRSQESIPRNDAAKNNINADITRSDITPANWTTTSLTTPPAEPQPLDGLVNSALPPQPLENFIQDWQSISQILSVMSVANMGQISHPLNNRLPNIQNPQQMTSGMVFFLAALGAKNPARTWLGPDISRQIEKAGQGKLLNMLDNDMQRIFRVAGDTPVNEWRPALIPVQVGGDVTAIPLLTRQVVEEDPDKKGKSGDDQDEPKITATRFLLEVSLSQFGKVQLDGLLKEKKLNIIIRTKANISRQIKVKISGMFNDALEISGFSGDLQFHDNSPPEISVQNLITRKIHMSHTT